MTERMSGRGRVLLSMRDQNTHGWHKLLASERDVVLAPDCADDPSIDYAVVWKQPAGLLSRLPNLKIIFSVGAGVDHVFQDAQLPDVPIVRMVADDLTRHMSDYVCWRVLDHHRQGMLYRKQQQSRQWVYQPQSPSGSVEVGIMGFGHLGRAAAKSLLALGFRVNGWSRRQQEMEGVVCFHGEEGLTPFLGASDILVVLLPLTPQTQGIVDFSVLSRLRKTGPLGGPCLINAGRGKLHREDDILRALDAGVLKEASLDVFEEEPLAAKSPLWGHPRVFITPHLAAESNAEHLVPLMLAQMRAFERGEPLHNLVDRAAGY